MNNNSGLNKNDIIAAACTIAGLGISLLGTVFGFKDAMQRADQINDACGVAGKVEPLPTKE